MNKTMPLSGNHSADVALSGRPMISAVGVMTFGLGPAVYPLMPNLITPLAGIFLTAVAWTVVRLYGWRGLAPRDPILAGLLVAFLVWSSASHLWSINQDRSLSRLGALIPIVTLTLVALSHGAGQLLAGMVDRLARYILVGASIGLAFVSIDILNGLAVTGPLLPGAGSDGGRLASDYNRGLSFTAGFALLTSLHFWTSGKKAPATVLAILTVVALALGVTFSAKLAALAFFVALPLAQLLRRDAVVAVAVTLGVVAGAQPFVLAYGAGKVVFPDGFFPSDISVVARIEIWDYVAVAILERPWLGWGLDVTRELPTFAERAPFFAIMNGISTHAHNNALELWSNLGFVGLAIGICIVGRGSMLVRRLSKGAAPLVETATAAWLLTVSFLAYGLWQTTWLAAIVLTVTVAAALSAASPAGSDRANDR